MDDRNDANGEQQVTFVAVVLGLLGAVVIGGFAFLYAKLGALADEQRDARAEQAEQLAAQLTDVAGKLQGVRFDMSTHGRRIDALTEQLEGPPSMRRPPMHSA